MQHAGESSAARKGQARIGVQKALHAEQVNDGEGLIFFQNTLGRVVRDDHSLNLN